MTEATTANHQDKAQASTATNTASSGDSSAPANATVAGLLHYWRLLQSNTLIPLLLAGAAGIALVVALSMWAIRPDYRVLFNNLSEVDGGTIIAELESRGVPYELGSGGSAILVPGEDVYRLRLQLAEQGLPQAGNVGFELMDNQSFGISQFAEQVNFQRSLEGELSRSIRSMSPVSDARVHISMPRSSVFVRDREPAKASVVLTLQGGRALGQPQIDGIIHLVSSSVPELSTDNVTVVSHTGELLSGNRDTNGLDGDRLSYSMEVERRYQQRIENILAPLYGPGNIRVQVAADIDFSSREETRETYSPNQNTETAAVRSTQFSGALRGPQVDGIGVPGALSNSPPGWTPALINAAAEEEGQTGSEGADRNLQYDNVVNYEVDRNIQHILYEQGDLRRLAVAVVINYQQGVDEDGNPVAVPLTEEALAQADNLIRRTMGFDEGRGDQLQVANSPFSESWQETQASPEPTWWSDPSAQSLLLTILHYLIAAGIALFFWKRLLRPLLDRHLSSAPALASGTAGDPSIYGEQGEATDPDQLHTVPGHIRPKRERKFSSYEHDLKEVRKMAHEEPRMIAMVVRSWMDEHE